MKVRDGMKAVALVMEVAKAGEIERTVLEAMGRAMEECKDIIGNLAEATMKSLEGMVEQMKDSIGRLEEGQVVERRMGKMEGEGVGAG